MMPTKILTSFATAPLEASLAIATGWTSYWLGAIDRRQSPLDVANDLAQWWQVTTRRHEPTWAHEHTAARTWPVARLLDYSLPRPTTGVATLVLPPQTDQDETLLLDRRPQS